MSGKCQRSASSTCAWRRAADRARAFSRRHLCKAIKERLAKKEQSILFLNRRGFSTSLICTSCGHVCECPNCSVALTFHRAANRLVCHICGHTAVVPAKCPECKDPRIRYSGSGTEKVEELVAAFFPEAVVKRLDADSVSRKGSLREALHAFRTGKIDILVGTQMIAKGLHFPNVTLVGIVNADMSLHLPDYRAGERTFQLLTQVAGRAGRGRGLRRGVRADLHAVPSGDPIRATPRFSRVLGAGGRVSASRRSCRPSGTWCW